MLSTRMWLALAMTIAATTASTLHAQGNYSYDGSGNIVSIGSDAYLYDRFGRVLSGTAGTEHVQRYTYDRYGNVLTITTTSPLTGGVASMRRLGVNINNNRIDSQPPADDPPSTAVYGSYDQAGRMTELHGTATLRYDGLDQITETTVDGERKIHLYTATDERIASFDPSAGTQEWTLRDVDARILRRLTRMPDHSWQWVEDYVYRGDLQLAALVSSPEKERHFHVDHLGTPRRITGAGGALVEEHRYYAFGEESTVPGPGDDRNKFTGHERDNRDLDYLHARHYGPRMARFLSIDPGKDWELRQPQSWNLYAYTRNNPVNRTDPTGRCEQKPGEPACTDMIITVTAQDPNPQSAPYDFFVFGSYTATFDTPVRPAVETVGLFGYNSQEGFYAGDILAGGLEIGSHDNYVGAFRGKETTTTSPTPETIDLQEAALGVEIPYLAGVGGGAGSYQTKHDYGSFVFASGGAIGQEGALGVGFSLKPAGDAIGQFLRDKYREGEVRLMNYLMNQTYGQQ